MSKNCTRKSPVVLSHRMLVFPIWSLWMHRGHTTPMNRATDKIKTYIMCGAVTWKLTKPTVKSIRLLVNTNARNVFFNHILRPNYNFRSHTQAYSVFEQSQKVCVYTDNTSKRWVRQTRRETKKWICGNNIITKGVTILRYKYQVSWVKI